MKCFKFGIFGYGVLIGIVVLAAESPKMISGLVEYSFNDLYKFIRTNNRVYQVRSNALTFDQKMRLDRIGSKISLILDSQAIENSWEFKINKLNENNTANHSESIGSFIRQGSTVMIVGQILPNTNDNEEIVQVQERIYRIDKTALPTSEKAKLNGSNSLVTLIIPSSAVLSSWSSEINLASSRQPASQSLDENFEIVGKMLSVHGVVGYSFDDGALVVQSGSKSVLINRAAIMPQESDFKVGTHVSLLVPMSAVLLLRTED